MKDLVTGAALLALAGFYWFEANVIPVTGFGGTVSAQGLPKLLALALALASALMMLQAVFVRNSAPKDADDGAERWSPANHLRAAGVLAIGVAYILLVDTAGYLLAIVALLVGMALYMGQRPSPMLAVVALLGAATFWLIFVQLLNIPLPRGLLPF